VNIAVPTTLGVRATNRRPNGFGNDDLASRRAEWAS
jgi:hypothetical protein